MQQGNSIMTYTVKFKLIQRFFWQKLKNVKADGFVEGGPLTAGPDGTTIRPANKEIRYFILDDESRIEIPAHNHLFIFSKERFLSIKINMDKESGQSINIDK